MDFMVPAGVRMDLADGSMRLPDEVGIPLNGRKRLYGEKVRSVILERSLRIPVGQSEETDVRIKLSATETLWVTRGERWIPTVTEGPGRTRYLVISNIGDGILRLDHRLDVGMILDQDKSMPDQATDRTDTKDIEIQPDQGTIELDPDAKPPICPTEGVGQRGPQAEGATATTSQDIEDEVEVYYHDSGDLSAEDLEGNLAKRHLLIGKGNALPPAAKGVVCDIDVGNAKPIALRTRKVPTRFREKVAGLIKGLLAAEIIRSTSPWASPIVIVRKSNGVDIRLCIDYKL
ncbi:hypothetical protein PHMEG_00039049, partial [Phytophthora megakarya]